MSTYLSTTDNACERNGDGCSGDPVAANTRGRFSGGGRSGAHR